MARYDEVFSLRSVGSSQMAANNMRSQRGMIQSRCRGTSNIEDLTEFQKKTIERLWSKNFSFQAISAHTDVDATVSVVKGFLGYGYRLNSHS